MVTLAAKSAPRPRRRLRIAAILSLVFTGCFVLAYLGILRLTRIDPPPAPDGTVYPPVEVRGERSYAGANYLTRERGIWEWHLAGAPFDMGYAHGRLGNRLITETDDYMFREMDRYVPSRIAMWLIRIGVRLRYRHLADHVPLDRQLEIAGQAAGYRDLHADFLPTFHRMIFYHALHDITQGLEHSPLLGCSAFAAAGAATENGHTLIGRNFDFEGPEPFDREKAILFFKPAGKIPFASVAWTGMTGVVTGINAEKIFVSLNAARTDDKGKDGIPVEILTREIMENARSIDDVFRMVKDSPVMVPDFYLVADGKTGESAVIERSPSKIEIRRSRDLTVLANHALLPAFAGDRENEHLKTYLTSGARFVRLNELVNAAHGHLDVPGVLAILRDRKGQGGAPLGLGNRNALDAIIATHSVVVDATDLTIWVSQGPHLIGQYIGYDLRKELLGEDRKDPAPLPPDALAGTPELRSFLQATDELRAADKLKTADPTRAIEGAEKAIALQPAMPEPHKLLGDLLRTRDPKRARAEYQTFLSLSPPYRSEIEQVQAALAAP